MNKEEMGYIQDVIPRKKKEEGVFNYYLWL